MMLANLGGLYSAGKSELQALINSLFGQGQQGLLFVPQPVVLNEQRLYKLDNFTDPVTAGGDPVGGGQEVSGNGNHLTQPTSADRSLYQTDGSLHWLSFDGAGDALSTDDSFLPAGGNPRSFIYSGKNVAGVRNTAFDYGTLANGQRFFASITSDGMVEVGIFGSTVSTDAVISDGAGFVIDVTVVDSTLGNVEVRVNGSGPLPLTGNTGATINTVPSEGLHIGSAINISTQNEIHAFIAASYAMSLESRDAAVDYCAQLAGITL